MKTALVTIVLACICGGLFLERCTMGVRVGDEYRIIMSEGSEFATIWDSPEVDGFDYRIEAVDGGAVMRRDRGIANAMPVVLLKGGEHALTIGRGKRWLHDPPGLELFPMTVSVKAGRHYTLIWTDSSLALIED